MAPTIQVYNSKTIENAPQWAMLDDDQRRAVRVVSEVLPFRTNNYVLDNLIDWGGHGTDPIFRLNFPDLAMLEREEHERVATALREGDAVRLRATVARIRGALNPHPAGQAAQNVPTTETSEDIPGLQHKYVETVLTFPAAGQTCHAFCTFCFRWPQFIGDAQLRFATTRDHPPADYIATKPHVSDVLVTGGDPLVMRTAQLRKHIEPILQRCPQVANIRIGTKALTYWPYRFTSDGDADDLLRLFEQVVASGRHLAVMAHVNHAVELGTKQCQDAIARIRGTGAVVRTQSPVLRHINDDPRTIADLWTDTVAQGAIPYYLFVERDTGPHGYFALPLERAHDIYRQALSTVSGLARTARGPSMSTVHGKVTIDGTPVVGGRRLFALRYLQHRDPALVGRPFFAEFDTTATWFDSLAPADGTSEVFFDPARGERSQEV